MMKSRLLVDYEIVEMSGTKLAIFKNGGEDVYVVNKETAYILNLLKKGFGNVEIVSEMNSHYGLHPDCIRILSPHLRWGTRWSRSFA